MTTKRVRIVRSLVVISVVIILTAQLYEARLHVRALTAPESLVFHRYWSCANLLAALMNVQKFMARSMIHFRRLRTNQADTKRAM